MEPKDLKEMLEELCNKFSEQNIINVLYVTDKKTSVLTGYFKKTDIKNMLIGILEEFKKADREEIINDVLKHL